MRSTSSPSRRTSRLGRAYVFGSTPRSDGLSISIWSIALSISLPISGCFARSRRYPHRASGAGLRQSAGVSGSRAGDAEQGQDSGGVAGVAAQGGGDVAVAAGAQDADGEVAQAGHGPWRGAGAELVGVLGEGDVADVVQRLDAPVAAHVVGQAGGAG